MFAQIRDLSGLRIEEGTHRDIPQSGDPLDGTWTRPDPALADLLFIEKARMLPVLFVYYAMSLFLAILISSAIMLLILSILILGACFVLIAYSHWNAFTMFRNHRFRVTDEELIIESGAMTVEKVMIPLTNIYEVSTVSGYWHRKLGIQTIQVGGNNILGLRNADDVAEAILFRVKQANTRQAKL